jgi:hypothetical protein
MADRLSLVQLDSILALQLSAAWAGEAAGGRLGWWKTDLVDAEGGGDFFSRLVPKTARWSSLLLVREAARRVDAGFRGRSDAVDRLWTLFHFGFVIDEQLTDRLVYHRSHNHEPVSVFGAAFLIARPWSREAFLAAAKEAGKPKVEVSSIGRKVLAKHAAAPETARLLFGALAPLAEDYPMPFMEAVE